MTKRTWIVRMGMGIVQTWLAGSVAAQAPHDGLPVQAVGSAQVRADAAPTNQAVATVVVGPHYRSREGDAERRDLSPPPPPQRSDDGSRTTLHGFRLGYMATLDYDHPVDRTDPDSSPKKQLGLSSPHNFVIGYEVAQRIAGGGWLDILLIANGTVVGLEQSKFMPNANLLLGFEFRKSFQTGVGVNVAPVDDKPAHMILAAGWTPHSGELMLPVHVFMIPDVDGHHRLGATVGVNWEL